MAQKEAADKSNQNMLFRIANSVAQGFLKYSPQMLGQTINEFIKQAPPPEKTDWDSICNTWVKNKYIDQGTADMLKTISAQPWIVRVIATVLIPMMQYIRDFTNNMSIMSMDRQYKQMQIATPHPAPVDNLIRSMIIDPGRSTENRAELKKHGFDNTQIDNIILSYYRTVEEGTIRTNYLRKNIDSPLMYERMRELGYTDTRIAEIVQTWELIPGPGDLFNMVAKEAFEPDIYTKLGLAEEFPTEQIEWLEKQGISPAWAMKYWIAHWAQPSIGQGFEMLHRGVINMDTLDLLFRAVEIPSFWRNKLTQIAYRPFTRVDVRRMHDIGVVNDEALIQAYLDIGYSPDKALTMANFTIKYNASHEKELTRGAILESYRESLITRIDASGLLQEQDYSNELADYYLTLEDYKRDKEVQKLQFDNIKEQYLLGLISSSHARTDLNKMGILGSKIDALLEQWELQLYKYQRLPSKADLDRFLVKGIIAENEYKELLTQHGFSFRHIQMYIDDMAEEVKAKGRMPSRADLDTWVKKKIITKVEYMAEMRLLGYDELYILKYLKEF